MYAKDIAKVLVRNRGISIIIYNRWLLPSTVTGTGINRYEIQRVSISSYSEGFSLHGQVVLTLSPWQGIYHGRSVWWRTPLQLMVTKRKERQEGLSFNVFLKGVPHNRLASFF